ncbi:MAG: dUTPase [Clostridiales bacterium]|jgi:dimeric dUTPase (all-alpha-NTP-PPase superfamily)|nr:dUTPase [Clostridiales bacterium]
MNKKENQTDKLQAIFERQSALDSFILGQRARQNWTMEESLQKLSMAMMVEIAELVNETNYKWWKNPKPLNLQDIREELVDILHFFVSMCHSAGLTADSLYKLYIEKNQENYDRQTGNSKKTGYVAKEE